MSFRWKPKHAKPREWLRDHAAATSVGIVALIAVAGAIVWAAHSRHGVGRASAVVTIQASDSAPSPSATETSGGGTAAGAVRPVSIDIPAINVHTTLQQLGLDSTGELTPPTNLTQAGWYTGSAVPGQTGPSVIAGHVDSYRGPAVFFGLKSLKPGDAITVGLSSGQHVTFQVMLVRDYPKDAFPTADVYGARPDAELRLITCGGGFAGGHYLDNVVVYAALRASA